jgi:drug/metabolite transporter (DMT)-like permease
VALSDNLRGILFMCLSMAAFTVNDTFMKSVTAGVPLFQVVFLRGLVAIAGLAAFGLWTGAFRHRLPGADWWLIGLRSLAEVLATLTFLTALLHMELANLSGILQALPLAVTLGAALVFGDKVGWRRLTAILVGFAGVMVIIRPGTAAFDLWSLVGVASVLCVVVRDLAVRRLGAGVPSVVVALGAAVSVATTGLALSLLPSAEPGSVLSGLTGWVGLSPVQAIKIAAAGSFLIVGYTCAVSAMRWGDVGVVAPFRYTSLLWAIVLGYLAFGDLPDGWTLLGSAIVVAAGVFTLLRENALRRATAIDTPGDSPYTPAYLRLGGFPAAGSERLKWS